MFNGDDTPGRPLLLAAAALLGVACALPAGAQVPIKKEAQAERAPRREAAGADEGDQAAPQDPPAAAEGEPANDGERPQPTRRRKVAGDRPDAPREPAPGDVRRFRDLQGEIQNALKKGNIAAAVRAAESQHEAFPDEMKATADLALLYARNGRPSLAEPLLTAALAQTASLWTDDGRELLAAVHTELGKIRIDTGRPAEAARSLERAIDLDPAAARPRFLLAAAFLATGDEERAARENATAFEFDAAGADARPANHLLLARAQAKAGDLDAAARTLETVAEKFPSEPGTHAELAAVRRRQGRPADALYELLFEQMLERRGSPLSAPLRAQIAALRAESVNSEDEEFQALGEVMAASEAGRDEEALTTLNEVARMGASDRPVVRLLLAEAYAATGRLGEAERVLTALLAARPATLPALTMLGDVYLRQDRRQAAAEVLGRARRLDGTNARLLELLDRAGAE